MSVVVRSVVHPAGQLDGPEGTVIAMATAQMTEEEQTERIGHDDAWVLASRICTAAGLAAQSQCALLELVGEFDAVEGVRWWQDIKSLAHWLSWTCSMSPGTAREHVRVARALRQMPTITTAFREGRLSYSKVREATRVVGLIDEQRLCELALIATASQLARMLAAYRSATGSRMRQQYERGFRWTERESGVVDVRIRLPKDEAAVFLAAVHAAKDQHGPPPASSPDATTQREDPTPPYEMVDAALDVARAYLATAPEDRSGEDRSTVIVHVAAEQLGSRVTRPRDHETDTAEPTADRPTAEVPTAEVPTAEVPTAKAAPTAGNADRTARAESVPAGTLSEELGIAGQDPVCHVQGLGGIEPETARRHACDADVIGAIVDATGDVLTLGRTRRLVSRAQRRALMIRDRGMCQFPGCHQTRHLKAHHRIHWADGGPTDLANLVLLCQFHHTAVHEGGMIITGDKPLPGAGRRWEFRLPDDSSPKQWWTAAALSTELTRSSDQASRAREHWDRRTATIDEATHWEHPDAARIRPAWAGEPFDLHACVEALFSLELPSPDTHELAA